MMLAESLSLENGLMLFAGVLALTFFSLSLVRRARKRMAQSRAEAREQFARLREHSNLHGTMNDLLLQLEDFSRRINAQTDTKFAKLETVVRDADDRIARLESLLARLERVPARRRASTPQVRPAAQNPARDPDGRQRSLKSVDEVPTPPAKSPETPEPKPARAAATGSDARPTPPPPADPRFQRIYTLADGGTAAIKIAEMIGMPLGEVEIILNLRRLQ